jgi:hypothetical protein
MMLSWLRRWRARAEHRRADVVEPFPNVDPLEELLLRP